MNIRLATNDDLRRIVEMSERFYPHTSYNNLSGIPFSPDHVALVASGLIENGVMAVAELDGKVIGMIGCVLVPFIFNPNYIHAGEIIWWVEPEYWNAGIGKSLIEFAEGVCKNAGAKHIQMISLPVSSLSANALYEKLGYQLTEQCFTKVL